MIYTLNAKDEVVRGNILVQGNRIAYVGGELPQIQAEREIDAEGNLVFPGFSNGHTHLPMTLLQGAGEDLPLMDWLTQKRFFRWRISSAMNWPIWAACWGSSRW